MDVTLQVQPQTALDAGEKIELEWLRQEYAQLLEQKKALEVRVHKSEERRRALMHILSDLNTLNRKLADQRKAMIHILADYEKDRSRLARQTERLDNSRLALMHILQDAHQSNLRLEKSRKAMIHILSDLCVTTAEVQRREQELREKQEQLVQAGKLATLGELTTGVAHELNNPLNNIGLFVGNVFDLIERGKLDPDHMLRDLNKAMQQVQKASQIIAHLRTFGRAAPSSREPVSINATIVQALSLLQEQLRLRDIQVQLELGSEDPCVLGNPIQLEQVFLNLLTNARDALDESPCKLIHITTCRGAEMIKVVFKDTGPGIPREFERRIFDPFFTTKEVGAGTGLGLSITYGIVRDHQGTIWLENTPGEGAAFVIELPVMTRAGPQG